MTPVDDTLHDGGLLPGSRHEPLVCPEPEFNSEVMAEGGIRKPHLPVPHVPVARAGIAFPDLASAEMCWQAHGTVDRSLDGR